MRLLFLAIPLCLLQSCIMVDRDLSGTPTASDIVGKCFALTNDTALLRYKKSKRTFLYSVELGGMPAPASPEQQARSNYEILPAVRKGSQVVISKVIDVAYGEQGRCLHVYGVLRDPLAGDSDVEIPVCGVIFGGVNQNWLTQSPFEQRGSTEVLHMSVKFLKPCDSAAP